MKMNIISIFWMLFRSRWPYKSSSHVIFSFYRFSYSDNSVTMLFRSLVKLLFEIAIKYTSKKHSFDFPDYVIILNIKNIFESNKVASKLFYFGRILLFAEVIIDCFWKWKMFSKIFVLIIIFHQKIWYIWWTICFDHFKIFQQRDVHPFNSFNDFRSRSMLHIHSFVSMIEE